MESSPVLREPNPIWNNEDKLASKAEPIPLSEESRFILDAVCAPLAAGLQWAKMPPF